MDTLNTLFSSINYRDPLWIAVAYLCGFLIWQIGLPPMVGYLFAGFVLGIIRGSGWRISSMKWPTLASHYYYLRLVLN